MKIVNEEVLMETKGQLVSMRLSLLTVQPRGRKEPPEDQLRNYLEALQKGVTLSS